MRFEGQGAKLNDLVDLVIEKSGLIAHYQAEREGRDRVENLRELVNAAAVFVSEEGESVTDDAKFECRPWWDFYLTPHLKREIIRPKRARMPYSS